MGRSKSYKAYFSQNNITPTAIPRRTRNRLLKPKRLNFGLTHAAVQSVLEHPPSSTVESVHDEDEYIESCCEELSDTDSSATQKEDSEPFLFPSCKITKSESLLLIYGFVLRHKLSKSAVSDLLTLINFHLPEGSHIPTSTFLLEKQIAPDFALATKNFYCPRCEQSVLSRTDICASCEFNLLENDVGTSGNFFITFNLRSSLQKMLSIPSIGKALQSSLEQRRTRPTHDISDIMDGEMYKRLPLGPVDITCSINTDGVNVFQSSKLSIWPILISMNELPYKLRRKHTLLVGLWFGYKKPNFDVFLMPFVEQCNDLCHEPISWNFDNCSYESRVYFPIFAADSVARCTLQGIKQFNGEYGCPWCLAPGQSLEIDSRKRKWIYPPNEAPRRTANTFLDHLKVLKQNLEDNQSDSFFGVKSASQLLLLKNFDIVDGFVFDYMHTCLLGVVKTLTLAWFDSANHKEDYYLGTREPDISKLYLQCKVPFECNRVTRELKDMSYWKANEWKSWMILSVPVLQNFLKPAYLKHFAKFVCAISMLNSERIETEALYLSERLLNEFCNIAPNLYGMKICTFNMHLLKHAVECVRNWGPLWAYSLFQYEHTNGVLTSYFSGTSKVCMQIIKKVILTQQVHTLGRCSFKNEVAKDYFVSLIEFKTYYKKSFKTKVGTFLGVKRKYVFSMREKRKLERIGLSAEYGWSFKSVIIRGRKYNVESSNTKKNANSICCINSNLYQIERLVVVNFEQTYLSLALCKRLTTVPVAGLLGSFKVLNISESVSIQQLNSCVTKKYICSYNENKVLCYVCELLNTTELE